jgi:hypothetical protein
VTLLLLSATASGLEKILDPFTVFTKESVKGHVATLADPSYEGRCTGEAGCRLAAVYVRDAFRDAGLEPGPGGSYYQHFHVETVGKPHPANRMEVMARGRTFHLRVKERFVPFGFSADGDVEAEVVFAGYGITAPESGYDDYAGLDVKGKIVLVLRHGPGDKKEGSPFNGRRGIRHTAFTAKASCAERHGAAAMLLFSDLVHHPKDGGGLEGFSARGGRVGIPCLHIKRRVAAALLACARRTPKSVQQKIDASLEPGSFSIPDLRVRVKTVVPRGRKKTKNVVGVLRGSDKVLAEEVVILGAHYDHIGRGYFGSRAPAERGKIHPGADDNATGTAGLILLAKAFASLPYRPKRTIVFIAFSGEEMGLLGSQHYAAHPLYPLAKTAVMINMDMIGHLRKKKVFALGAGTSPGFSDMVSKLTRLVDGCDAVPVSAAGGSDQMSFYAKKVPVLFFCTGGHPYYHTPRDTIDRINFQGEADVLKLIFLVTARLAGQESRPVFQLFGSRGPRAQRDVKRRASLGIIPDQSYGGRGIRVLRVMPGSPARKAGMQRGDVVVRLGTIRVSNLDELTKALKSVKPGQRVSVIVLRDDVEKEIVLQFP